MKIDIAVISYQRPHGLQRLLGGIQALRLPEPEPVVRVVVVDNDAEESAREVCEAAADWLRFPLVYVVEKRRGIPQARNTAVATALAEADFLAFVDDDEVPEPDWLRELLRVAASRGAEAVAGPVVPAFEEPAPGWIERGGFFEHPRHTTGARIDYAFSHNVLVSTRSLASMDTFFAEDMGLMGGSDAEFFRRFAASGRRVVWADLALVREWIPASRASLDWILRRAFRIGTSGTYIDRRRCRPPASAVRIAAHGAWCVAKGALGLLLALPRGRAACARSLRLAAFGAGRLAGLADVRYEEYRRVHGH